MSLDPKQIIGTWVNEYDSTMKIHHADDGVFRGRYTSHTGDTGKYKVVGVYDAAPPAYAQAISFSISWRSLDAAEGEHEPGDGFDHAASAFSGQIQPNGSDLIMPVIHVLTSPHKPGDTWQNSLVDKLTFVKKVNK
jgi:hypothetical protein